MHDRQGLGNQVNSPGLQVPCRVSIICQCYFLLWFSEKGRFMFIRLILLSTYSAIISIGLAGCATGLRGETVMGQTGSLLWFKTASPATQTAHFSEICRGYGFKDGTNEMSQCLQTETISTKARVQQGSSDTPLRSKSLICTSVGNGTSICN